MESVLRMMLHRAQFCTVPLWSCRQRDRLCPVTIGPIADRPHRYLSSGTLPSGDKVSVALQHGLPHITVPLPSRNEPCIFALRPVTHSLGDFLNMLRLEDPGIDRAVASTTEGVRIASTTSIQTLMQDDFDLIINDKTYRVDPPEEVSSGSGLSALSKEELQRFGDVRKLVGQLYEALNVEEHQVSQEQQLIKELEMLKDELAPLEESHRNLVDMAERRTNHYKWISLGLMSVQFGILARLTWWEYSWDIMEPVTYFVTYGTAMAWYAYFVLTREDNTLPEVKDRQFLLSFYRRARKMGWDVQKYNSLRDGIANIEQDLKRLRDPLRLRLPTRPQVSSSILQTQMHIGHIRDMLKAKFASS